MLFMIYLCSLLKGGQALTTNPTIKRNLVVLQNDIGNPFSFFKAKTGKFFKMGDKEDANAFGGPPVIILGGFSMTMSNVKKIVEKSAPKAWERGIIVRRAEAKSDEMKISDFLNESAAGDWDDVDSAVIGDIWVTPVVFFSGINNEDLRLIARGLVGTLFQETGSQAAVAKAVPPAMEKTVGDLFREVSRDHSEAVAKAAGGV
mmetsp:Transcript_22703/g.46525  ORF Transcript_22703/g.46525 Transcript_22703/m.46525 type:complete len:203 (+) Transcript_22703:135-743(+)|eukprot:CAMPEP_0171611032 /NCGR_PEP_ID=MMETSP0990-20121206/10389_1 /TAXON_ID=483369 /ORGANISM="non described non described, Strain CCMP2098" /LENGTH=202 /DNA_ID=CAMNT_0012174527 /DNA_START=122 /DNA_END=730 /DNA_ORIENTATION=+